MSMLKHPLLLALSKRVDKKLSPLRWIDLYAAQYIADLYLEESDNDPLFSAKQNNEVVLSGTTLDLFDSPTASGTSVPLSQNDLLVLTLLCSYAVSQGRTFLSMRNLSQDVLNQAVLSSAKACGYKASYSDTQGLLAALQSMHQPALLRRISVSAEAALKLSEFSLPLDEASVNEPAPLVLWQDQLYLAKYWMLHQRFEAWLQSRSAYIKTLEPGVLTPLASLLKSLFKLNINANAEPDWQAVAAAHTLLNPFSVITGGPGTGKTTTAASLLCLLIYRHQLAFIFNGFNGVRPHGSDPIETIENKSLHIRLLAPTGKAAVRLADAIRHQLEQIESRLAGQGVQLGKMSACLPASGETVHRFLYELGGLRDSFGRSQAFKGEQVLLNRSQLQAGSEMSSVQHPQLQQPLDVIIVDESSMMDLALMVELVSLIPAHTQVILLGDHFQLPAVDPGQVFADCVRRFSRQTETLESLNALAQLTGFSTLSLASGEAIETLGQPKSAKISRQIRESELGFQPLCALRKTYRFAGDLKQAADYIKNGETQAFIKQFWQQSEHFNSASSVVWHALNRTTPPDYPAMAQGYVGYFEAVAKKASLPTLAKLFESYQLLCSNLEGPLGVQALNLYIEQRFQYACFANSRPMSTRTGSELYHGKAILVSRNHPHLGIYNGDIGFVIEDPQDGNLNVHFPASNQTVIVVPPARIKEWQTAYAMTVHKSQGSEYQRVGVVLADYAGELLSRALLYTAVTRSKEQCTIWAGDDALKRAMGSEQVSLSP